MKWEEVDGSSKTHHALVGRMRGSESACVCLLFIAVCSASYKGNWCFVRPSHQSRPSMTLNILSRQTSDPSPKETLTLTPIGPQTQFLAPD